MKSTLKFILLSSVALSGAVRIGDVPEAAAAPQAPSLHQKVMHNTKEDDAYLTKVFGTFSVLGLDAQNEANGRRVLTKFNAMNAAREVVGKWKGLRGVALDKYLDDNFEKTWKSYALTGDDHIDVRNAYYWVRQLAGEEYFSA